MAILKIARAGHPVLLQVAEEVVDPTAPDIRALVRDMVETLEDAGGIGLAAPQVHMSARVVIFFVPERRTGDDENDSAEELTVMINPIIEPGAPDTELDWEACLSLPGMMGAVPRFTQIKYSWTNLNGDAEERTASGFHARAVQHECDHLDGILYPMRMTDMSLYGFAEEVNRNRDLMMSARPETEDKADADAEDEAEE